MSLPPRSRDLIDTHVHFDNDRFDADRDQVYRRAIEAGVSAMVIPATVQSRWEKVRAIASHYDHLYPTLGLHPLFCNQHQDQHLQQLQQQAPLGVAIGECGLDKQKHTVDLADQRRYFDAQIQIAKEAALPLIIHARNTVEEVILMLKNAAPDRVAGNGVVHSFNGSIEQAHRLIDLNFKLSFGGPLTFPNARKLHRLVARLPLDAIMLETDAPDQPAGSHRGERNEPQWLPEVLKAIAELRSEPADVIAATNNRNAITLFNLPVNQQTPNPSDPRTD